MIVNIWRFSPRPRMLPYAFLVTLLLSLFFSVGLSFGAEPSIMVLPPLGSRAFETFKDRHSALEKRRIPLTEQIRDQVSKCKSVEGNDKQLVNWCRDKSREIAPLWKKYEEDTKLYQDDVRAALISDSSSSSEEEMTLLIGYAFRMGDKIRDYAHKSLTSMKDISLLMISVWNAERGSYQKARHLFHFSDITKKELKEMDDILLSLEHEKRALLKGAITQVVISGDFDSRLFSRYPNRFSISLLRAHLNIKAQNFNVALKQIESARKMNIESQALADAEVYVRQMKASAMEKRSPTDPALITQQKNLAGAYAGWSLGMLLMDAEMDATAIQILTESARTMAREGNIEDSTVIYELANTIPEDGGKKKSWLPSPGIYDTASEADILLDSLEYGSGDWKRSMTFLELAHKASSNNERISEAIAHVQALMASQK